MKNRLLVYGIALLMIASLTGSALEAEPSRGTRENPLLTSLRQTGRLRFEGINAETDEDAVAQLDVLIEGQLPQGRALERINQLAFANYTGDSFFIYRVLLSAHTFEESDALSITAADFKVYDEGEAEIPILTKYEEVEAMEGFPAWLSIGVSALGSKPAYLVLADTLWFDLRDAPVIEE